MHVAKQSSHSTRRLLSTTAAFCVAGAMAVLLPYVGRAQDAAQLNDGPAPTENVVAAQNLEDIATPAGLPKLTVSNALSGVAHLRPLAEHAALLRKIHNGAYFGGTPPLLYHSGGSIMQNPVIYNIFWVPAHLQNGNPTSMSASYQTLMNRLAQDYNGHGLANTNTQYFQTIGRTTTYVKNQVASSGGSYVDTSPYPASACTDAVTPGNCLSDAQIQAEIQKVMGIKGWTGGLNHIFMLYTSSGEGSCFNASSCAYIQYCAYHSFINTSPAIIYGNMPYGNTSICQNAGVPSPTGDPIADAALTAASHEISESITDPLLNAWFTSNGYENGDLCAYDYGPLTYDSSKANQSWNGHFYLLQQEFDNHAFALGKNGCVQTGPFSATPTTGHP